MLTTKKKFNPNYINKNQNLISALILIIFIILLLVFWNFQILKYNYYKNLALMNIYDTIKIKAPRGLILDKRNHILAKNRINFSLFFIRKRTKDIKNSIKKISKLLNTDEKDIENRINKYKGYPKEYPILIKRNIPLKLVIFIQSQKNLFPEFEFELQPARSYPNNKIASHIIGYISEIPENYLKKRKYQSYELGDLIGITGIENKYERYLKGIKGNKTVIKNSQGIIKETLFTTPSISGANIHLTLDFKLQSFIENLMKDHKGAVGVVDLSTGGILALVSKPNFNPEELSSEISTQKWLKILNNPNKPLTNRFIQGIYSPGSVFKIIMSLAALQERQITTSTYFNCFGEINIYNRTFHCWNSFGHGPVNIYSALEKSCNIFFYNLGKRIDIDIIAKYAKMLGLGSKTGIDLPNEKTGLVPSRNWKQRRFGIKWFPGETISVAIGHGQLNVTPVQILKLISIVALRGIVRDLHLIDYIEKDGITIYKHKNKTKSIPIDKKNFEIVIEGLYRVVNKDGTAKRAQLKDLKICGKTGTAQIISKENINYKKLVKKEQFKPHSWFASFAPRNNPKIAIVVLIENGGNAGSIAAPLASKIYKWYFKK